MSSKGHQICLVIHTPRDKMLEDYKTSLLDCLRLLLDSISSSQESIVGQTWMAAPAQNASWFIQKRWDFDTHSSSTWWACRNQMIDQSIHVSVNTMFNIDGGKQSAVRGIGQFELLSPYKAYQDDAGLLWLTIPQPIWSRMNHPQFLHLVTQSCVMLNATYACIDKNALLASPELTNSPFWLFAEEECILDPDAVIPSVCWWQYWDTALVNESEPLDDILKGLSLHTEKIVNHNRSGITLHYPKPVHLLKAKDRLELRNAFSHSFPPLSIEKLAIKELPPHFVYLRDNLPLTEQEKMAILSQSGT